MKHSIKEKLEYAIRVIPTV